MCTTYEEGGYSSQTDDKQTCKGHNAGDLTFWRGVYLDDTGKYVTAHKSNEETRVAVSPYTGNYMMPYIYDNFQWDHCNTTGECMCQPNWALALPLSTRTTHQFTHMCSCITTHRGYIQTCELKQ